MTDEVDLRVVALLQVGGDAVGQLLSADLGGVQGVDRRHEDDLALGLEALTDAVEVRDAFDPGQILEAAHAVGEHDGVGRTQEGRRLVVWDVGRRAVQTDVHLGPSGVAQGVRQVAREVSVLHIETVDAPAAVVASTGPQTNKNKAQEKGCFHGIDTAQRKPTEAIPGYEVRARKTDESG